MNINVIVSITSIILLLSTDASANGLLGKRFDDCLSNSGVSIDAYGVQKNKTHNVSFLCNSNDHINQIVINYTDTTDLELENTSILNGSTISFMYKDYTSKKSSLNNKMAREKIFGSHWYFVTGAGYADFEKQNFYEKNGAKTDLNGLFMTLGVGLEKVFKNNLGISAELGFGMAGVINHKPLRINVMYLF